MKKIIFNFNKRKKMLECKKNEEFIMEQLENLKQDIKKSIYNFENETDNVLIEFYIYEYKALNIKYQYYIKLAKKLGITGFKKIS